MTDVRFSEQWALLFHLVARFERIHIQSGELMTDADKTVLDTLEREALALLERATFSIRDENHAHADRPAIDRRPSGRAPAGFCYETDCLAESLGSVVVSVRE